MDYHIEVINLPVRDVDFADPDGNTWIVQERAFTRTASTNGRRI
jgi:hypothetical protein